MKKSIFLFSLFLLSLLSGCSTGRQSRSYNEVATSSLTSCSDSLLLRQMEQLNRNRTVQLEHIVFNAPDSSLAEPVVQSITRITASEQAEQNTATSLDAGTIVETVAHTEEVTKKERKFSVSPSIYWGILLIVLLLLVIYGISKSRSI